MIARRANKVEQADGKGFGYRARKWLKQRKNRLERRRANQEPECVCGYGKYAGYLT